MVSNKINSRRRRGGRGPGEEGANRNRATSDMCCKQKDLKQLTEGARISEGSLINYAYKS